MDALKKSIKTFGLVENIVINSDYTIIGGHQRFNACLELGYTEIPCVIVDLDKKDEKKLNIMLNNPHAQGRFDMDSLNKLLNELKDELDFEELNLNDLLPPVIPNLKPEDLVDELTVKKPTLKITFDSVTDLENAKVEIEAILKTYTGADLCVSAGEL